MVSWRILSRRGSYTCTPEAPLHPRALWKQPREQFLDPCRLRVYLLYHPISNVLSLFSPLPHFSLVSLFPSIISYWVDSCTSLRNGRLIRLMHRPPHQYLMQHLLQWQSQRPWVLDTWCAMRKMSSDLVYSKPPRVCFLPLSLLHGILIAARLPSGSYFPCILSSPNRSLFFIGDFPKFLPFSWVLSPACTRRVDGEKLQEKGVRRVDDQIGG